MFWLGLILGVVLTAIGFMFIGFYMLNKYKTVAKIAEDIAFIQTNGNVDYVVMSDSNVVH